VRGKKKLSKLASGFVFLLAKLNFYSYLASWQVVIRTPAISQRLAVKVCQQQPD
jgi:hypothetical protein